MVLAKIKWIVSLIGNQMIPINNIDIAIEKLEYVLEADPRTFSNQICENEEFFNEVYEALKHLKKARLKYFI